MGARQGPGRTRRTRPNRARCANIIDIVRPANVTPADGCQERIAHDGVDVIDVDGAVLAAQGESVPE